MAVIFSPGNPGERNRQAGFRYLEGFVNLSSHIVYNGCAGIGSAADYDPNHAQRAAGRALTVAHTRQRLPSTARPSAVHAPLAATGVESYTYASLNAEKQLKWEYAF